MLTPVWKKNDRKASVLIITFSAIVFIIIASLSRIKLNVKVDFDIHIFAKFNAITNSIVAILLLAALIAVKNKKYEAHKKMMLSAMALSILFLISYICHHLVAGETRFGDVNHDGNISELELANVGSSKKIYYFLLLTHIPFAGIILPFILFTAYRSLIGEYARHKKLARITWPIWFYVAVTGVVVYLMINPYYV